MLTNSLKIIPALTKLATKTISKAKHSRCFRLPQHKQTCFYFSSAKSEKMEFKAETKKLLDIVAKSLYTDS